MTNTVPGPPVLLRFRCATCHVVMTSLREADTAAIDCPICQGRAEIASGDNA